MSFRSQKPGHGEQKNWLGKLQNYTRRKKSIGSAIEDKGKLRPWGDIQQAAWENTPQILGGKEYPKEILELVYKKGKRKQEKMALD